METTLIHPDCIVKHADRRAVAAIREAEAVAQLLRRNRLDWLNAFNRISDIEAAMSAACYVLEAILDDFENPAPRARDQVEALRQRTAGRLQRLQKELRETCLFNGPARSAA